MEQLRIFDLTKQFLKIEEQNSSKFAPSVTYRFLIDRLDIEKLKNFLDKTLIQLGIIETYLDRSGKERIRFLIMYCSSYSKYPKGLVIPGEINYRKIHIKEKIIDVVNEDYEPSDLDAKYLTTHFFYNPTSIQLNLDGRISKTIFKFLGEER